VPRDVGLKLVVERIKRKLVAGPHGCHLWTGWVNIKGYGQTCFHRKNERCHRLMWEAAHGAIPKGLIVCHTCDTPACCNVQHMWLGTIWQNGQDAKVKKRCKYQKIDNCKYGHPLSGPNMRPTKLGGRQCRICQRAAQRKQSGWPKEFWYMPPQARGQRPCFSENRGRCQVNGRQLAAAIADFYSEDPKRWTQYESARNPRGDSVSALDRSAVQWCISGAVDKLNPKCPHSTWMELRSAMPGGTVVGFNDQPNRTVSEVIAQLRVIATPVSESSEL
jgi:hypothetical protein